MSSPSVLGRPPKAALIGGGFIGPVHAEALRRIGVAVVGLLGSSPARARPTAERLGIGRVYDDLDENTNMATATYLDSGNNIHTGANCWKSISVGSNRSLTVPANFGPLYVNGGNVDLQGAFSCTGCSVVLTNTDPSNTATIGTFSSNAQATNNITAPTAGAYKGIAVYQDRRATGNVDRINGGSGNVISGVVYFPKDTLWLNGKYRLSGLTGEIDLAGDWRRVSSSVEAKKP